ncbi:WD40 repeat domain-containing protein (plasmid) [Pseudoalteromonas sp. T1lg65]|uniref:WD40 repeat domain-containing protein n=1 Tax=Pseudoalteromonas sp. T1lg65 TaxID=2077101 RepID=UPI003F790659
MYQQITIQFSRYLLVTASVILLSACSPKIETEPSVQHQLIEESIVQAQFNHDASQVWLMLNDHLIQIWDTQTFQKIQQIDGSKFSLSFQHADFAGDNTQLLTSAGNTLIWWDLANGAIIKQHPLPEVETYIQITSLAWSTDKHKVAVGYNDGRLMVFDFASNTFSSQHVHDSSITRLHFSDDGTKLLSASLDGNVNYLTSNELQVIKNVAFNNRITSLAVNHNVDTIFVSDALNTQQIIFLNSDKPPVKLHYPQRFKFFREAVFLPDGQHLLTTTSKSPMSIWDINTGKELISWPIEQKSMGSTVYSARISSTNVLSTISSDAVLEKWPLTPLLFEHK